MIVPDIHEAVWEWLQGCPHIRDLYFNFAKVGVGDTVLIPMTAGSDAEVRAFIGGSERRYSFALARFNAISDAPNSAENLSAMLDAELLTTWVEEQNAAGKYPTLPDGCTVIEAAVYPAPSPAALDINQAKFMFQFYIDYLKEAQ